MKLTVRGKILVYKVTRAFLMISLIVFLFLPYLTVEWTKDSFGISSEYYAEFSFIDWLTGAEKQIHTKNAEQIKDLLGVSQDLLDERLGKVYVYKDGICLPNSFEQNNDRGAEITISDFYNYFIKERFGIFIFLVSGIVIAIVIGTWAGITTKKKTLTNLSAIELQLSKAGNIDKLDKQKQNIVLRRVFGIDPHIWACIPVVIIFTIITYIAIVTKNKDETFSFTLSGFSIYFLIIESLMFVVLQILAFNVINDLKDLKITTKSHIHSMKYFSNKTIKKTQYLSIADELKKYKELLDDGVITQEEFDAKKKQLLGL